MDDLNQALADIRDIRRQVAQSTEFRGYGPVTLLATALVAVLAGVSQARWIVRPTEQAVVYVAFWMGTAVLCALLIALQMLVRARSLHGGMADGMIVAAVMQFLPAAVVGVAVPLILLRVSPGSCWMLPGLWKIVLGLGIFASRGSMPPAMVAPGVWFLCTGLGCLALGADEALSPMLMAVPFSTGMAWVAGIHWMAAKRATGVDDEAI